MSERFLMSALACHGECGQLIRPVGPPASLIEVLSDQRLYCLACLMATCARPIDEVWPEEARQDVARNEVTPAKPPEHGDTAKTKRERSDHA